MKMFNKLLFSIFIILTITHTVQNSYIVLSYISYNAKVMSGDSTMTDEDFHTIQIKYDNANPANQNEFVALEGTPTPKYLKGYIFADNTGLYSKPPVADQTTINYVYENYLPGAQKTNLVYSRKKPDNSFVKRLMDKMTESGIEYRRGSAGGGNQTRQPYIKKLLPENSYLNFPETEHIHFFGFYIGNFPDLNDKDIDAICSILNSVK